MNPEQLLELGISRLRIPIPMVKLQIVHEFAKAIATEQTPNVAQHALLRWLGSLELESEILEALAIVVLAKPSDNLPSTAIRSAIRAPSVLSDLFIERAYESRVLVNSWLKGHSIEVPALQNVESAVAELSRGQIVPRILKERMVALETLSGKPFMRQWAFEFEQLLSRAPFSEDGHFSYFAGNHRHGRVGQFIARRGHLARSAFLRTLAAACDFWDMPKEIAERESLYASPVDFSLLPLLPGDAPSWAVDLHRSRPTLEKEFELAICNATARLNTELGRALLHLHLPLVQDEQYRAELEVITVLSSGESVKPEDAFLLHSMLPGKILIPRASDLSLTLKRWNPRESVRQDNGDIIRPALLPVFDQHVGYFHSDLVGCMPCLPANNGSEVPLVATIRRSGADLRISDALVGELHYWNWNWRPMHEADSMGHCGIALTIARDAVDEILHADRMHALRVWRATIRTRSSEYGDWQTAELFGALSEW
jgi:hypothetical protein